MLLQICNNKCGTDATLALRLCVKPWSESRVALRRDPSVAAILRSWRNLTRAQPHDSQRRTLVACSGGADSTALLLALSSAGHVDALAAVYIQHDMRPAEVTNPEVEHVQRLATSAGVTFISASVHGAELPGNQEHNLRSLRYAKLKSIAVEKQCSYVATGHHADDQLETFMMRLMRGAGPRALGGMRASRQLSGHGQKVLLIRPMLHDVTHQDSERICEIAGVTPLVDATNADISKVRAKVRATVLPALRYVSNDIATKCSETLMLLRGAGSILSESAKHILESGKDDTGYQWSREQLRKLPRVLVSEVLRSGQHALTEHHDGVQARTLLKIANIISDSQVHPRSVTFGGVEVTVTVHTVRLACVSSKQ